MLPNGRGSESITPSCTRQQAVMKAMQQQILEHGSEQTHVFLGMTAVIASEPMRHLMSTVERVARSSATVLIAGESGSGKELVARAIHHYSMRSHKPWVDLSCAALPEHLLESELFGYDKGAFSGADSAKPGLFELAHQGTIFLDEIGELDPKMQVKLLRVLDGVPYYRLGGVKKVSVDVRVVAATNQDLELAVAEGRFRSDLYHRLGQITLRVPPLRKRMEDVAPLARHFLAMHDPNLRFSASALAMLATHSWPGNTRELRNVVTKAAVLAQDQEIGVDDLPAPVQPSAAADSPQLGTNGHVSTGSLDEMERRMVEEALIATGGHQQKAAARLGISRRTLSRKLRLYESERVEAAP
jgi:DNA-binding NtrC family response regulator